MVKPGVYTVDKKQLKNGDKTTEYIHVEVQPLPPKSSAGAQRKGCTCSTILGIFLFLLVLAGIAIGIAFAIRWEDHPENNGNDCIGCYEDPTMPARLPEGEPHHGGHHGGPGHDGDGHGGHHGGPGHDGDGHGGHHGGPGNDDDDQGGHHGGPGHDGDGHGGHHGGPGNDDDDQGGHHGSPEHDGDGHGGHHGGPGNDDDDQGGHHGRPGNDDDDNQDEHDGRPEDNDGHGNDDDRPDHPDEHMPPIDYIDTPIPLLGRPDGHDGFHGDDHEELVDGPETHGRKDHPRFMGIESWKQQRAMLRKLPYSKQAHPRPPVQQRRSRVEIEEEALERSPHAGKNSGGRKRF